MTDETRFEFDAEQAGHEAAVLLRELADGFENGPIAFGDDLVLAAPPTVGVEIEVEVDGRPDGSTDVAVELEFEWVAEDPVGPDAANTADGADDTAGESASAGDPEEEAAPGGADGEAGAASPPTGDDTSVPSPVGGSDGPGDGTGASVPVAGGPAPSLARFQLYRDRAAEWRWRLVHRNGNIIATGGEGYSSRAKARQGLRSVVANAPGAEVTIEGEDGEGD